MTRRAVALALVLALSACGAERATEATTAAAPPTPTARDEVPQPLPSQDDPSWRDVTEADVRGHYDDRFRAESPTFALSASGDFDGDGAADDVARYRINAANNAVALVLTDSAGAHVLFVVPARQAPGYGVFLAPKGERIISACYPGGYDCDEAFLDPRTDAVLAAKFEAASFVYYACPTGYCEFVTGD